MSSITAVGSSNFPDPSGPVSTAGLDAQLAQYQIQLAAWVNCPSCNTPEGKAKIQELSAKVSETKQSIKAADTSFQSSRSSFQVVGSNTDGNRNRGASTLNVVGSDGKFSLGPASVTDTIGTFLNVFA